MVLQLDDEINGLSKQGILAIQDKMRKDPSLGKSVPIAIEAIWKEGVVTMKSENPDRRLVCHPPPEIARTVGYPSMNSYCPLASAGCYSMFFMMQAAERDLQFHTFETDMTADADFSCFYQAKRADRNPWGRKGVVLDIRMTGKASQIEIDSLGEIADERCPSVEVMRKEFPIDVSIQNECVHLDDSTPTHYDMEKFQAISNSDEPHIVRQKARGTWFCFNESQEFPDAMMAFEFQHDGGAKIPLSQDPPVHNGKYANPIEACFFGGLSTHMHTVAMLIYSRGYKIQSIHGKLDTTMNKRIPMMADAVKEGFVFPRGSDMQIHVVSNVPHNITEEIAMQAEGRSPALMNWLNPIPLKMRLLKEDWDTSSGRESYGEELSMFSGDNSSSARDHSKPTQIVLTSEHSERSDSSLEKSECKHEPGPWAGFLDRYKKMRQRLNQKKKRLTKKIAQDE